MSPATLRFPREYSWVRWACLVWGGILLVLCARVVLTPLTHNTFLIFAQAGRNWHDGASLYGSVAPPLDVFRYSPLVAGLLVPLSVLPIGLASSIWILINATIFLAALFCWQRAVSPSRFSFAILALAVLPLALACLHNGQCNALVIGLVVAGIAAVAVERWNLAAACIALATFLKLYPLAVGLLLVAVHPRKFGVRLVVALGIGLLLPFLMQQPGYVFHQYGDWVTYLQGDDRTMLPLNLWMRDFRLLCHVWLVTPAPAVYLLIQALAGLGTAGLCLAAARRGWPRRELLTLLTGLGCCWMVLFGPGTEPNTFVLLAPSLGLALGEAWSTSCPRWRKGYLACIFGLMLSGYVFKWFAVTRPLCDWGPQPLAALLFFVLLGGQALVRIMRRPAELAVQKLPRAA
ncbi:MAG TPA: glycosyltransferase family 87 protein [Gemmataceae bacterium]|nr:glycosyltransferase family 87 protein [Gemmataceae bacterium]